MNLASDLDIAVVLLVHLLSNAANERKEQTEFYFLSFKNARTHALDDDTSALYVIMSLPKALEIIQRLQRNLVSALEVALVQHFDVVSHQGQLDLRPRAVHRGHVFPSLNQHAGKHDVISGFADLNQCVLEDHADRPRD